jgi:23S rRNA pseudouridine1911/1915/1917 synthase
MQNFNIIVAGDQPITRLDKFLTEKLPSITRSKIQDLIKKNAVHIDNATAKASSQKIKSGQNISIEIPDEEPSHLIAKQIPFDVVYEDEDLLIINKPYGLTVHPGSGNKDNTLVNGLLFNFQENLSSVGGALRPGIVHRLDKNTSGLMLVAKNDFTHRALSLALQKREVKRWYLAFIYGCLDPPSIVINKNIARSRKNRIKMTVVRSVGRNAITNCDTKKIFCDGFASLVECRLETGRTHQIRVHLESEKHSVIGDQIYSGSRKTIPKNFNENDAEFIKKFPRQALHSYKISFLHPVQKREISFEIDLPDDLKELEKVLIEQHKT